MLQLAVRVKAAAGQQYVEGTDGAGVTKADLNVVLVQFLQKGTLYASQNVRLIFLPAFLCKLAGDRIQLPRKADVGRNVVMVGESLRNSLLVFFGQLPKVGALGIWALHGVPNVKDIFDLGRTPAGVQDSDAPGTPAHGAAHALIPHVETRAGGGIGALGVN